MDPSGRSIYGFLHLTFAEYLAGRYLAEQWSTSPETLSLYAHDPRWREVILLMAGHVGTWAVAQISKLVMDTMRLTSEYEEYIYRDLFSAASMLADNARVTREVQDLVVHQLIDFILADRSPGMTAYARYLLRTIGQITPLGSQLSRIEPTSNDNSNMKLKKAALCLSINYDIDAATRILLDGLFDNSVSSSIRFDAQFSLLGNGMMEKADVTPSDSTLMDYGSHNRHRRQLWSV